MKSKISQSVSLLLISTIVLMTSGCASKTQMTQRYMPQGELHATNFGGVRKLCIDSIMYISSYNGMTPAIDNKSLDYIRCATDEYGRVIALSHAKKGI